jgi:hypothetical protein
MFAFHLLPFCYARFGAGLLFAVICGIIPSKGGALVSNINKVELEQILIRVKNALVNEVQHMNCDTAVKENMYEIIAKTLNDIKSDI